MTNITSLFPLWAIAFSSIAYLYPSLFSEQRSLIVPLLALVMFGMGLTLRLEDFSRALRHRSAMTIGLVLQYSVMPLAAILISLILGLEEAILIGMVLVGTSPGGTASNVICYLSGGNVALSITLTAVSTLLAVLLTPMLTLLLIGERIEVPVLDMLISISKIILLPVGVGILLNRYLHHQLKPLKNLFPALSVFSIVYIIAIIIAINADQLHQLAVSVLAAVILHNSLGLFLGYILAKYAGCTSTDARTLAIEVGMQNSGLAVALAIKYFPAAAALPGALFSIWHNISGSLLAGYWSRSGKTDQPS